MQRGAVPFAIGAESTCVRMSPAKTSSAMQGLSGFTANPSGIPPLDLNCRPIPHRSAGASVGDVAMAASPASSLGTLGMGVLHSTTEVISCRFLGTGCVSVQTKRAIRCSGVLARLTGGGILAQHRDGHLSALRPADQFEDVGRRLLRRQRRSQYTPDCDWMTPRPGVFVLISPSWLKCTFCQLARAHRPP